MNAGKGPIMLLRGALVRLLARYDVRPTLLRFPTRQERHDMAQYWRAAPHDEFVRARLSPIIAHLGARATPATPPFKLHELAIDACVERADWDGLARLAGAMYGTAHYRYAECMVNHLASHERAQPLPDRILARAYRVPEPCVHEFTDGCVSIDSLARLMDAVVKNRRWSVADDFLAVAKDTYRSGGRVALARVVLRRGTAALPRRTFALAIATDPIVSVRSTANYELFWGG